MKPQLTIDLVAPEGNAYMLIAKAQGILIDAGLRKLANELGDQFEQLANNPENTYQDVRHLAEQYCTVTWLNEYARFKGAVISTQEAANELSDTLEALRMDLDDHRPINTTAARDQIQELREALSHMEHALNTLPAEKR